MTDQPEISDETLMALADGELSEIDRVKTESAIRDSAALNKRFQVFVRTREALNNELFDRRISPETDKLNSLIGSLEESARSSVVSFHARKKSLSTLLSFRNFGAMAATLVIGVMIGFPAGQFATVSQVEPSGKHMFLSFPGSEAEKNLTKKSLTFIEFLRSIEREPGKEIFSQLKNAVDKSGLAKMSLGNGQGILIRSVPSADCLEILLELDQAIIDQARICRAKNGKLTIDGK